MSAACDECLRRSWLIGRLAGHLEAVRERLDELLALPDRELVEAIGGRHRDALRSELRRVDAAALRSRAAAAGLELLCRCDAAYPPRLFDLSGAPAVLHVAGGLERFLELVRGEPVAVVGARRASEYGLEVARSLGRGLGCAGVTVVSGMALGIDSAAQAAALGAGGATVAVMPGGADRPYPAGKRSLYNRICAEGTAVSELPVGAGVWRWSFPARNRIIAALSAMTVIVEGRERSGALMSAAYARQLGRPVGAVPGRVTSSLAAGPNALLADGAAVVRGPQDVLDELFGAGVRSASESVRAGLDPALKEVLAAVGDGRDTVAALARAGIGPERGLAALSALELAGYVRHETGGRYTVVP
jgi:DNA processing protein